MSKKSPRPPYKSPLGLGTRATHVVVNLVHPVDWSNPSLMAKQIGELGVSAIEEAPAAGGKAVDEIRVWVEAHGFQLHGDLPPAVRKQLDDARALLEQWGYKVTQKRQIA